MKTVTILLSLTFLLIILPVNALVILDSFDKQVYNSGDKLFLNGEFIRDVDTRGYLNFNLQCGNNSARIATILVDTDKADKQKFSQLVLVPRNVNGECEIEIKLTDESTGETIEVTKMVGITITDELNADFAINKNKFQLGETLELMGNVNKKDNSLASGSAAIYFNIENQTIFLDSVTFNNGELEYKRDLGFIPPGEYNVDVELFDNFGNKKFLEDLYLISISGNLKMISNFDKSIYDPGNNVILSGSVYGLNNAILNNVEVDVLIDGKTYENLVLQDSNFYSINYPLAKNIKSGKHAIIVNTKADGGNYGKETLNFTVTQIPTKLNLDVKSSSFIPGEEVFFSLNLIDQAGDNIEDTINVALLNKDNKIVSSGIFTDNGKLKIPEMSKPNTWKVKAEKYGLNDEAAITIKEYTKLETELNGDKLTIKNIGNIKYKGPLTVIAGSLEKNKNIVLGSGENKEIDLKDLLPNGIFDLKIPTSGKEFKNVAINKPKSMFSGLSSGFDSLTGNVAKNVEGPSRKFGLGFLLLILVGCTLFLVFRRKMDNGRKPSYENLSKMKTNKMDILEEPRKESPYVHREQPVHRQPVEYGKATQEDIDDFKRRMVKNLQEENQKKSWNQFVNQQKDSMNEDNKPKGGMFNMF